MSNFGFVKCIVFEITWGCLDPFPPPFLEVWVKYLRIGKVKIQRFLNTKKTILNSFMRNSLINNFQAMV